MVIRCLLRPVWKLVFGCGARVHLFHLPSLKDAVWKLNPAGYIHTHSGPVVYINRIVSSTGKVANCAGYLGLKIMLNRHQ